MRSAELVDAAVTDKVIVFGSLPPGGRDLDLLVRPGEGASIREALGRAGFLDRGAQWVHFDGSQTDAVDLVPVESWGLDPQAIGSLFQDARTIEGYRHLVRPAPHHALLVMARRVARSGGELDAKKRARVHAALEEDKDGWAHAQSSAAGWSSRKAVVALERLYRSGVPTSARARMAALAEIHGSRAHAMKIVLRAKKHAALVTFSGLDGSGKTSQAEAVRESLETTSGETVIVWTRLSYNPSLKALAAPIKALLGGRAKTADNVTGTAGAADPGKELRKKSAVVTQGWATAVAIANAAAQRRVTRYHLRRGRNVISDRYTLDSRVHLRYRYGERKRFRVQAWIISAVSPTPTLSYLVEVPPEVAYERKAEQYDLEQLQRQARLYREEADALDVTRLDGTRPRDELAGQIGAEVWRALP
jgi:thymidylate kinase